jgi:hypothetical protein
MVEVDVDYSSPFCDDLLGPLTDPTPSERALSLLHMACGIIGLAWPESGSDMTLAIVIAERKASEMACAHRKELRPDSRVKAEQCNDTAVACSFTNFSLLAAKRGDKKTEDRYAGRALEHLAWVPQYKGPNHGR